MGTIYVCKGGNDANTGADYAHAKLTIQAGATAAGGGGTVIIGAGYYSENVVTTGDCTFQGDGYVVWDGGVGTCVATTNHNITVKYTNFNGVNGTNASGGNGTAVQCRFLTTGTGLGCQYTITATYCSFEGCTTGASASSGNNGNSITFCQFANCTTGISDGGNGGGARTASSNIFYKCGKDVSLAAGTLTANYNCHFGWTGSYIATISGTNYATWAAWQAAGYDAQGLNSDPAFHDSTHGDYTYGTTSPCATASSTGDPIGPYLPTYASTLNNPDNGDLFVLSNALDPSSPGAGWVPSAVGAITLSASGYFQLSTSGSPDAWTLTSPVFDMGAAITATRFEFPSYLQNYPTQVVDTDNSDTAPNRTHMEYRSSSTSFNQADASPTWNAVEVTTGMDLGASISLGRYLQVRLTFRDNGVAA